MAAVNEARAASGLVPLRSDPRLWSTRRRARRPRMAAADVLSHDVGRLARRQASTPGASSGTATARSSAIRRRSAGSAAAHASLPAVGRQPGALGAADERQVQLPRASASPIGRAPGVTYRLDRADRIEGPDGARGRPMTGAQVSGRRRPLDLARAPTCRSRRTPPGCATSRSSTGPDRGAWVTVSDRHDEHGPIDARTGRAATGTACGSGPATGPGTSGPWSRRAARLGAVTPMIARHPFAAVNLISDPIHGYVELTKRLTPARVGGGRPARRGRRRGGPPRHRLAPAAAPDQPAPERALGLPDGRALALHPRPRASCTRPGCGPDRSTRACARALAAAGEPCPVRGPRRRDAADGRPAPRRRPRAVRPLLRRPRPGRLRRAGRSAAGRPASG